MLKLTQLKKDAYLDAIRQGKGRCLAAESVGLCRSTIAKGLRADPAFAAALDEAELVALDPVEDKLLELAMRGNGNLGALLAILYNRNPARWKQMQHKEVSHKMSDLSDEQIHERLKQWGMHVD